MKVEFALLTLQSEVRILCLEKIDPSRGPTLLPLVELYPTIEKQPTPNVNKAYFETNTRFS